MSERQRGGGGGIGISGAVFLIFLTLKLLGIAPVASWSWWWITSPLWIGLAFIISIAIFGAGAVGFFAFFDWAFSGRKVRLKDDE